ncbi:homoserine dehydrogenase [Planctomycetales bacterium]|nr:homoserine dehydrogenase [Planctomycetales bacterium]GHT01437.1 homoserine dehydrogenase [Planctomycetales bacterium]GHT07482.1 homoserine dehydrogenase [Planctomycetales bacterium]GHV20026.1 homoserine dehydrogenase [Planctomycetales bacterium]
MQKAKTRVAVVGVGTVGSGVVETLLQRGELLRRRGGVAVELAAVVDRDREKAVAAGAPENLIFDDFNAVVARPDIDIVVELVGGTGVAEKIIASALDNGKAVVTANKALLAEKGLKLFAAAREHHAPLAFEAAVGGGIPCIQAIRDGLISNNFSSCIGILNGTCNYILTEMITKGQDYDGALKQAQALGFAEANPRTDVEGFDTGHKLAILSALGFETWIDFDRLPITGIAGISATDIACTKEMGYVIKLLAVSKVMDGKLFLSVHPGLLNEWHVLAGVHGSLNAISLFGDLVQEAVFIGRGAGKNPTASAVVADIISTAKILGAGLDNLSWLPPEKPHFALGALADYTTRYYLRFTVADHVGVLAQIAASLSEHRVGIASVVQHERNDERDSAMIIAITDIAREGDVQNALTEIDRQEFSRAKTSLFRIEG